MYFVKMIQRGSSGLYKDETVRQWCILWR